MTGYLNQNHWASLAQAQQQATMSAQEGINGYVYGNSILATNWDSTTMDDLRRAGIEEEKPEPSEFKKLANHRFHDLLSKFGELTGAR